MCLSQFSPKCSALLRNDWCFVPLKLISMNEYVSNYLMNRSGLNSQSQFLQFISYLLAIPLIYQLKWVSNPNSIEPPRVQLFTYIFAYNLWNILEIQYFFPLNPWLMPDQIHYMQSFFCMKHSVILKKCKPTFSNSS